MASLGALLHAANKPTARKDAARNFSLCMLSPLIKIHYSAGGHGNILPVFLCSCGLQSACVPGFVGCALGLAVAIPVKGLTDSIGATAAELITTAGAEDFAGSRPTER